MSSVARRTQGERREATREALLRAAVALVARRGVTGASLQDVSARAGVTKGALVHHFEHKDALLDAVVDRCATALEARCAAAWAPDLAPWARVRASVDAVLATCCEEGEGEGRALVELALAARADARLAERLLPRLRSVERAFARGLDAALGEMGLTARASSEALAGAVWTMALGAALRGDGAAAATARALEALLLAHFVPRPEM